MKDVIDDRNRRLLETARDCILNSGLQGASMAAISKAARVPVGTIYNMYPTKEALINAVYSFCRANTIENISFPDITSLDMAEEAVKDAIVMYLDNAIDNSNDYLFVARYYLDPVIESSRISSGNDVFGSTSLSQLYGESNDSPAFFLLSHMVLAMINKAIELHLANLLVLDNSTKRSIADICWRTMIGGNQYFKSSTDKSVSDSAKQNN